MNRLLNTLLVLLMVQGCKHGTDVTLPLNTAGSCHQKLMILGTLERVRGMIVRDSTTNPIIYAVALSSPQQVGQYQISILTTCNIPDTFKSAGRKVSVSGRVLTYGKDIESRIDTYGQPFDLTAITNDQ